MAKDDPKTKTPKKKKSRAKKETPKAPETKLAAEGASPVPETKERLTQIYSLEGKLVKLKRELITYSGKLSEEMSADELTLLLVETGDKSYATPISFVDEVLQIPAVEPVDNQEAKVAGLLNFHGRTLAVVDLKDLLGHGKTEIDPEKVVLICSVGSRQFGLVVEDAIEVLNIRSDALTTTDEVLPGLLKAAGVVRLPHVVAMVLDMNSISLAADLSSIGQE